MNGVAKEFWSEIFDLRKPVADTREKRVAIREKKLLVRRTSRAA